MASQLLEDFQERAVALKSDKPELRQIIDQLREEATTRRVEDWGQLSSCRISTDGSDSEAGGSPGCGLPGGGSGNAGSAAEGAGFLAVAGRVAIGGGVGTGPGRGPLGTALAHYVHRWTSAGAAWMDTAEMAARDVVKYVLQGLVSVARFLWIQVSFDFRILNRPALVGQMFTKWCKYVLHDLVGVTVLWLFSDMHLCCALACMSES
jgi:hypothetical protein